MVIKMKLITKYNLVILWLKEVLGINEDELFYINGPQTLPPPLSKDEEADLINRLGTDTEAKKILVEHNLRLVVYIAKKFENTCVGIEDLISIGTIGLMKAINTFRAEKQIKLATYASRCIENEILMYIRKNTYLKVELSLDEPLNIDYDGNELLLSDLLGTESDYVYKSIEENEDKKIIMKALNSLSERDRQIIQMRFGINADGKTRKEKTQKEVADLLGISQSYISRLEKRIIEKLKEYLTKQNY
ncbi:MAG: RNA polymerase sporulation sigma factor SigE [Firmicutes bacterium HGW-Firmicutes-21]|nr:MAG: RNA polymerase sporulation sigma factor SigE [Firmicutes bacterium HGW-Firmicutes-21]